METEVIHDKDDCRFYAKAGNEEAELTYTFLEGDLLDFDYVYVPKSERNTGLLDKLVKAGMEYAKENGYKVIPSCPGVEKYTDRHSEYNDLLR